ncbi:Transcription factor, fungi [Penicillium italicum]|uniref:Transcription factor, fungi n=1 Tax=Penicillium italicum TaxID=40296 RepID=A0A0A2KGQ3_PENIT|nr:Transcription factor, fungi [Penicillium italicum]
MDATTFENPKKNNGRKRPRCRDPVSCNHCRKSKVRCDRKSPCKPCQARGLSTQCTYSTSKRTAVSESARPIVFSRSTGVDRLALEQLTTRSSDGETLDPGSDFPQNQATLTHANSAFKGSNFKTRLIGGTHWMAPCNDLPVIGAMLEKTVDFQTTWRTFTEVKSLLRIANSVPAGVIGDGKLLNLLPDRSTCEKWIRRFSETYGRIYHVIDHNCLITELDEILMACVDANEVHVIKILLVIAIAMQTDKSERLRGRLLLQEAERRIHTSTRFQKPCIGVVQALLLLVIMKTITASDTDKIYTLLGIMGLTTQMALSMGLHRDPALFPGVTPYYAEVRKRLWACFFRLNLDYCIRSGSNFGIRLEDVDCPLPSAIDLLNLDPGPMMESGTFLDQAEEATDQAFNIAAMKLAIVRAPLHQRLCSTSPGLSNEVRDRMRASFQKILRELPPNLQEGASSCSPIEKLQQALLSMHVHSFMIIITLNFVLGVPSHNSQRGDLYEAWDSSVSILHQSQEVLQIGSELSNVAYHLLWTDLARAALTACLVVGRLRRINLGITVSNNPQPTLVVFQQLLLKYLDSLSQIVAGRYYLGPVAAKTRLVLAVATTVTSSLVNDLGGSNQDSKFFQVGVKAAKEVTAEMERALKRENKDSTLSLSSFNNAMISAPPSVPTPLTANWMDQAQLPDHLIQTLFPSDCDFYPESESPGLGTQSDLYSMAFKPTLTIQSTTDLLWEEV